MKDIENLNKTELLSLRDLVEIQLKTVEKEEQDTLLRKNSVKNKTKISQLTSTDRMFGLVFAINTMKVRDVGYCNVEELAKAEDGYYRISVSHKTKPIGVYGAWINNKYANKPYFACYHCSTISFFTLRPETWEKDLKETLQDEIKLKNENLKREAKILNKSVSSIIKEKAKINKAI